MERNGRPRMTATSSGEETSCAIADTLRSAPGSTLRVEGVGEEPDMIQAVEPRESREAIAVRLAVLVLSRCLRCDATPAETTSREGRKGLGCGLTAAFRKKAVGLRKLEDVKGCSFFGEL